MTSRPWFDPGAGVRSVVSVASDGEIRFDLGVRRPEFNDSGGSLVGTLAGTLQYNAWVGTPTGKSRSSPATSSSAVPSTAARYWPASARRPPMHAGSTSSTNSALVRDSPGAVARTLCCGSR